MKRFFTLFLAVSVCLSLCVSVAFAQTQYDSYIHAYFPWFGGVSTAGAYLTNTGTVTTSDVSSVGTQINNVFVGGSYSPAGVDFTYSNNTYTVYGTSTANNGGVRISPNMSFVQGHNYVVMSDVPLSNNLRLYDEVNSTYTPVITDGLMFTAGSSSYSLRFYVQKDVSYDFSMHVNLFDVSSFDVTTYSDFVSLFNSLGFSFPLPSGISYGSDISSFSLVPQSTVIYEVDQYTHDFDMFSLNVSLTGSSDINRVYNAYFLDDTYNWYFEGLTLSQYSTTANLIYMPDSVAQYMNSLPSTIQYLPYTPGQPFSYTNNGYTINHLSRTIYFAVDSTKLPFGTNTLLVDNNRYYFTSINMPLDDSYGLVDSTNYSYFYSNLPDIFDLESLAYVGDDTYTGTISLGTVSNKEIYNTVIYSNNTVNLGTYDFNINVVFPSLAKFNAFSGYWSGSFNTSWGEIPVRAQVQEVSSNIDTLIKVYKVTFDVPFTGQYSSFNIKYVGASNDFTTIRVDSSVIDPNAYKPTQNQVTSLNGFTGWLNGALDSLWGKIRSLFFDQDQTYEQVSQSSVSSELVEGASEVSDGASTIHEYETENFDSIEEQMDSLDWDIPNDFGSADNPSSAIGFISTFFGGIFLALGSKVQVLIVIPLMLGLCLLILGRGSQALGAINKLFR